MHPSAEYDAAGVLESRPPGQRITAVNLVVQQQTFEESHLRAPTVNGLAQRRRRRMVPIFCESARIANARARRTGAGMELILMRDPRAAAAETGGAGPANENPPRIAPGGPSSSAPSPRPYIRGQQRHRDNTAHIRANRDDSMKVGRSPRSWVSRSLSSGYPAEDQPGENHPSGRGGPKHKPP